MPITKKILHWLLFAIGGYLGTWFALAITFSLPLIVGQWLFDLGDFLFILGGSIALSAYYFLVFFGLSSFYSFINSKKPDYWFSNIFLVLVTLLFFNKFITIMSNNFADLKPLFSGFKGTIFLMSILPAYLKILFLALIAPFIAKD